MTSYPDTLNYLFSQLPMFHRVGAAAYKDNLDNTLALSKLTGAPEQSFPSIHIAGTNGKGSVSALLASILQSAGYKTALFTSPHLRDFRERIRINGKMIPKGEVTAFVSKYRNAFETLQPSFFEMTFALAMDYFARNKPDIAVVETGMGGRLDSTNIVRSILSIITNIGSDHMAFLGDTPEKIAVEKAGIIKPGVNVVIGETQSKIDQIFIQKSAEAHADIVFADQQMDIEHFNFKLHPSPHLTMEIVRNNVEYLKQLKLPLGGLYQLKNTLTVLESVEQLRNSGYTITEAHIYEGFNNVLKNTGILGRWQLLSRKPLTLCDTAHNINGIREVVRQLRFIPCEQLHVVFGMVADKEIDQILEILPHTAIYYFCKPDIPRGLDAGELFDKAQDYELNGSLWPSVKEALHAAQQAAGPKDLVFVGGSTFVVAEVV